MLPPYLATVGPYLNDKTRLFMLTSNSNFGYQGSDEHMMSRLNNYVESIYNPLPYKIHDFHHSHPYPDLDREKTTSNRIFSDLVLRDSSRQNTSIEERYRHNMVRMGDLVNIYDPVYKYHRAISRGHERHLVNMITSMDEEMLNRQTIQPLVI